MHHYEQNIYNSIKPFLYTAKQYSFMREYFTCISKCSNKHGGEKRKRQWRR